MKNNSYPDTIQMPMPIYEMMHRAELKYLALLATGVGSWEKYEEAMKLSDEWSKKDD